MIRAFRASDADVWKEIIVLAFDGVSMDQNMEEIFGQVGPTTWQDRKRRAMEADVLTSPEGIFVAEEQGQVVGFVTCRLDFTTKIGWVVNMGVRPGQQGRGIGKQLLTQALDYLRSNGMEYAKIETLEQNEVGKVFYPKAGFREIARQIHYLMKL